MVLILALSPPHRLSHSELFKLFAPRAVALYLASSGVYAAMRRNPLEELVSELAKRGEVKVSREDLSARGLSVDYLIEGIRIPRDFYGDFVEGALRVKKVLVL
jgi:sulfur relay protein TusB/DsrH